MVDTAFTIRCVLNISKVCSYSSLAGQGQFGNV